MSKYLPTYDQLANRHSFRRCRGILPNGQNCYENHKRGTADFDPQYGFIVHWQDRRPSRPGIMRFLNLIAYAEIANVDDRWRRQYRAMRRTVKYLQEARVRVPAEAWHIDKTRLKSKLLDVPTTDPEREEAMNWALNG